MTSPLPLADPLRPRLRPARALALGAAVIVASGAIAAILAAGGTHPHARAAAAAHPVRAQHRIAGSRRAHAGTTSRPDATLVAELPDPLAAESYPDPAGARNHARAASPSRAVAAAGLSPGAPTLSQVESALARERAIQRAQTTAHGRSGYVDPISGAFAPANVIPLAISEVIAGGNAIADFPYLYGGGHASFEDNAYDCSGSVSYALAAGGLIGAPETSGQLEHWGVPGPGRWLTVFANAGHTFMYVDGLWFDTAGRAGPYSTRWLTATPSLTGYVVRHYPGL